MSVIPCRNGENFPPPEALRKDCSTDMEPDLAVCVSGTVNRPFPAELMFLLKRGSSRSKSSPNLPPGPGTIPILGNLHMMDLKKPQKTMTEWSKEYGPIFRIKLGLQEMVVLTGYETVKEALVNEADVFADRPFVPIFEDARKGLVFAHGENWKVMRRFTLATLRDYGMGKRTIEDKITEECSVLTKTMEIYGGKPFDIKRILTAAVSNIIVSILLGKRYEYEDAIFLRLLKTIRENIQLLGSPAVLLYNLFPKLGYFLGVHKIIMKNQKELHDFIKTTFIEYLQDLDENDPRNFIESFLVWQKQENMKMTHGGYFHNKNLIGLVDDLFVAGTDTTSNTLSWAILLMMKYPEIQSKIQAEIAREIGDIQPRTEHRVKMPYTDAVIHEFQRFSNIIPSNVPHATTMDITFKGFFIPKGTYIIPLLTSVLRDESQWEKPHEFYPEHFLDSEGKFVKRNAFMPFSAGRRVCAGENLAKMELFLFFTNLLQKFTFQTPPGTSKDNLDLTPVVGFTSTPMPYKTCAVLR
ncbi:cytochrome P450 2K1-like [Erythrolamprus reginae]|uniref:cytochrome P450 2K1-like n=1 Tax=Erythrolamprus reginae TaxID=121349 RepID=UPI00396C4868